MRWHWFLVVMSCLSFFLVHADPLPFTKEELKEFDWIKQRYVDLAPLTWLEVHLLIEKHKFYPLKIYEIHKDIEKRLNDFKDWKIIHQKDLDNKIALAVKPLDKATVVLEEFILFEETYMDAKKKK